MAPPKWNFARAYTNLHEIRLVMPALVSGARRDALGHEAAGDESGAYVCAGRLALAFLPLEGGYRFVMPQPLAKAGPLNVAQAFAEALALHERGRLGEAEPLYARVLAARPDHVDGLQMMALVKLAKGQAAEALQLVSAAMRLRAPSPKLLLNHGLVLNALQRPQEALDSFDRALKLKSKFAEAYNNRGAVLAALGRDEEALESYRKAVSINPRYAEAHYNRGNSLRTLGRYDEALTVYDRALALDPKYLEAHNNRAAVLEALNRLEDALACYSRALALDPGYTDARNNRGRVLCLLNRFDEALAVFDEGLRIKPDDAEAYYNRGRVYIELDRRLEATADLDRALSLQPDYAEARFVDCLAELPILYATEEDIGRRRAAYARKLSALRDDVDNGKLISNLAKAVAARQPFLLAYQGQNDRDLQALYGGLVTEVIRRQHAAAAIAEWPEPGQKLRVGIVSAHFHLHSNWKIPIKGWISQLDRRRFELLGYYLGNMGDAETDVAAGMCDRFVRRTLDADGWRREILNDSPHVLIYPGLLMDTTSIQLAAQRLAPVQATSWGHPETSGLATIDYFLSSDLMEPPEADGHYTEKLVRLPNLSIYYEPVAVEPVAVARQEFGLREDAAAFWCGQSLYKYLPQHDCVFARIAKAAPHSQFVFLRHHGGSRVTELFEERLERAFAAEGLASKDHCVMLGRMSQSKFVAAIGQCDVFLDSLEWSGCNSALESLAHDLPIVTLPGALMRSRHSAAILRMMGVTETIAADLDGYIAAAARLANAPEERMALRRRMAENKAKVYRDRSVITALENFLERVGRPNSSRTSERAT
jgi:predicted O-linked N-acetylglucosamine transferase (SPINDLY family)